MNIAISGAAFARASIVKTIFALTLAMFAWHSPAAFAQNVTVNPGAGSYVDLKSAFDAINAGTHTGAVTVSIIGDTTETVPAVLNASGSGAASYTSILITPSGVRSVSGAIVAGSPLVDLSGADNVTIDGLNAAGNSLTISNSQTSTTLGTSTVRFINDATSNTIQNATINGAAGGAGTGTILFSTTTGTTGNDNNTITACSVGPVGATFPANSILSSGTTTSVATRNSGIQVTNNRIFDFFTNTAVIANGILASGSTDWTITGNSFYQTAARTLSVAASGFIGVSINDTTGVNFVISNNFIGGSAVSAGGAAWTQTGAVTHTFIGIRMSVGTATPSSLQGNTIQNISISTSTVSTINAGIAAVTGSMNVGTTAGNTIGSSSLIGSISWTGAGTGAQLTGILAGTGTPGVIAISNNTVGGVLVGGAGTTILRGINIQGLATSYTVNGNTIGSASVANSISNSTNNTVGGIVSASTSPSIAITNNTIANLTTTGTATANLTTGIATTGNVAHTITGNTIRNFTSSSIGTSATGAQQIGISMASTAAGQTISQNTIHSFSNSAATAAVSLTGIFWNVSSNSAATNIVERNFVHSLSTTSTGAAIINGIFTFNGGGTYRNNMIRVGIDAAGGSLTSGALVINGIQADTIVAATNNFLFNSIFVGGTGVGAGTATTSAFKRIANDTTVFRDNIAVNNRSNGAGTGKHYLINVGAATTFTSNNNVHNQLGTGAVFGVVGVTDSLALANWRTNTSQDLNSFFTDPQFLSPTGTSATVDLHINPSVATVVEGNGALISPPTDDFDGQTRASLTPVDIGADAGNFSGIDLSAPAMVYTVFGNTTLTTNRVLSVTMTDATGVATGGLAPRIYFNKNAGAFTSTGCSLSSGTVLNGVWNCTIDNSLVGGVVTTDVIRYYVVAQDTLGNLGANPGPGFTGTDVNTVTTPPTTPNQYTIAVAFTGVVNVGGAETITSLTNAGGLFATLNGGVLTGNLVVNITSDLAGEGGTIALNALSEEPAGSNFTLTIQPSGVARTITSTVGATTLIKLNGASRVTINGSIGGVGTDRSLTIEHTGTTTPNVIVIGSVGTTPVANDTIRNCILRNGATTSSAVVISDAGTVGNPGLFSNITVQNNSIQRAFIGVFAQGGTVPQGGSNLVYTQNNVDSTGTDNVRLVGLYMQGVNGATVSQNTIANLNTTNDENDIGIWLASGTINATVSNNSVSAIGYTGTGAFAPIGINVTPAIAGANINVTGNSVSNIATNGGAQVRGISTSGASADLTFQGNNVQGIINTNTGTFGAYGMDISAGNNIVVKNNFVSNVSFTMTGGAAFSTTFGVFGIRVGSGSNILVDHNSVNLYGALPGTAAASLLTAPFALVSTASLNCDIRNNIFANNITGGTTSIAHVSAFLPSGGTSAMNLAWNNNAYFFGADAARQGAGQAGTTAGTNFFTTLAALAAYSSTLSVAATNDNASIASTAAVPYVSNNDLHITAGAGAVIGGGVFIPSIPIDIDNDPRVAFAVEIGADELPQGNLTITPTTVNFANQTVGTTSADNTVTLANTGAASLDVTALTAATTPFARTAGGTCSATLPITIAAGANCTLTYTFTPTATGLASQVLTVTANAPGSGTITLNGTGIQGNLTITPTTVPFGTVSIGGTGGPNTVTLANTGTASLNVTALTAAAAPFARTAGGTCSLTLPITIAAGANCTLTYTFTPTAAVTSNQTLTVTANAPGSGTIDLSGTGSAAAVGNLTITPTTVPFGNQTVGTTSAASTVTLANTGTASLNVTALTAAATPFARTVAGTCSATLPITIAAGANCTLTYTFTPTAAGAASQVLTVTANAPGSGTITLTGTGLQGALTITPTTVPFGNQTVGTTSAASTVTLANTGTASLNVTALTAAAAPFARTVAGTCSATLPITIAAGANCTLTFTFAPVSAITSNQTLTVTANAPGSGTIALSGTGVQNTLSITPSNVLFGNQKVGTTSPAITVTLTNTGATSLSVTTLTAAAAPFARTAAGTCSQTLPIVIAAGTNCTLNYTFAPSATGPATQTLTVTANAPSGGTITLSGTGTQGNLTITPPSFNFGTQEVGTLSGLGTITLGNTGAASLSVTSLTLAIAPFQRTTDGTCGNSLPFTIAVGGSCTITYRFMPVAVGPATQMFTVGADGPGATTFSLNGAGIITVDPIFSDGFE